MDDRSPIPPPPAVRARRPADPPHLSPEASAALAAASAALAALEAPSQEPEPAATESDPPSSGQRKPIDLFPSAAHAAVETRTPADVAPAPTWRGRFVIMIVLLVLMFAGAAFAGWMFREPLTRAMMRWHIVR